MEARLSMQAIERSLDGGHSSLKWKVPEPSGFLGGIDLDQLALEPNVKEIVQSMPIGPLLFSFRQKGLTECGDILPHLTMDQVTRLLDYDVWVKGDLARPRFYEWLMAFHAAGKKELAQRFMDLEEEYQLSLLVGKIRAFNEEDIEGLSDEVADRLYRMPCNTVFYLIMSEVESEIAAIEAIIESVIEENLSYAYALISHAAFAPGQEAENLLAQFREARMGEDGFVPYDESLLLFAPLDVSSYMEKWQEVRERYKHEGVLEEKDKNEPFLGVVLSHAQKSGWDMDEQFAVHQNILYVANSLCTAVSVEASDVHGLNRVLVQVRAMVGLGLDYLSQGSCEASLLILKKVTAKELFRIGVSLLHGVRKSLIDGFVKLSLPDALLIKRHYESRKLGAILYKMDRHYRDILGAEVTEILKGLFNRFPMCPILASKERSDRVEFVPVDRMRLFLELRSLSEGVLAVMHLADCFSLDLEKSYSLEKILATLCVQAVIKGKVVAEPISPNDLKVFVSFGESELNKRVSLLDGHFKDYLTKEKGSWAINESFLESSLAAAMHIIIDSLVGVLLAAKNAKDSLDKLVIVA